MVQALRHGYGIRAGPDAHSDAAQIVCDQRGSDGNLTGAVCNGGCRSPNPAVFRGRVAWRDPGAGIDEFSEDARMDVRGGGGRFVHRALFVYPGTRAVAGNPAEGKRLSIQKALRGERYLYAATIFLS